jgi:hypothetical protein
MRKLAAAVWGRVVNGNGPPPAPMNRSQLFAMSTISPACRTGAGPPSRSQATHCT